MSDRLTTIRKRLETATPAGWYLDGLDDLAYLLDGLLTMQAQRDAARAEAAALRRVLSLHNLELDDNDRAAVARHSQ